MAVWHAMEPGGSGRYGPWEDDAGRTRAVGWVIRAGGQRVFHGGDLVHSPGLEKRLAALGVDVAVLPVNGRDWAREARGLVGNLTGAEAAELARAAGAHTLVPVHWDGVVGNTADPGAALGYAARECPGLGVVVPGAVQGWTPA